MRKYVKDKVVNRSPLAVVCLMLSASLAAAALPWKTREEAMAESVLGFFAAQQLTADLCEERMDAKGMVTLRSQVKAKYRKRIDQAGQVREGYFQRSHGENWRAELVRVNEAFLAALIGRIVLTPRFCGRLASEMKRQLEGGWACLAPKIEAGFRRGQAMNRECEGV